MAIPQFSVRVIAIRRIVSSFRSADVIERPVKIVTLPRSHSHLTVRILLEDRFYDPFRPDTCGISNVQSRERKFYTGSKTIFGGL